MLYRAGAAAEFIVKFVGDDLEKTEGDMQVASASASTGTYQTHSAGSRCSHLEEVLHQRILPKRLCKDGRGLLQALCRDVHDCWSVFGALTSVLAHDPRSRDGTTILATCRRRRRKAWPKMGRTSCNAAITGSARGKRSSATAASHQAKLRKSSAYSSTHPAGVGVTETETRNRTGQFRDSRVSLRSGKNSTTSISP